MRKATIILLCVTIIWSYTKTAIDGANSSNCLLCKEAKTLFCRKKSIESLESIQTENAFSVERLVADENKIKLSKSGVNWLNNMTSLRFLDLRKNEIELDSLDHAIEHDKLEELDLHENKIKKIPPNFFGKIPNLEILILSNNDILNFPYDLLENNTHIKALVLSNNKRISTIRLNLFENSSLEALLVDGTSLEDISFELLNKSLPKLIAMNVRDNEKMVNPLDPKIFYEHPTLRFLFTSGYADCCNVKRMKKRLLDKDERKKWHCSYKHNKNRKESCAIRIRSAKADDTFMGHVEVYKAESGEWKKITGDWTMNDANVVCKETGHEKALAYINNRDYPRRKSRDDKLFPADETDLPKTAWKGNCTGSEYSIFRCPNVNWSNFTDNYKGVGVRCKIPEEEMKKACNKSDADFKKSNLNCARKDLNNLPWQDQNDTIVETIDLSGNKITWIQDTSLKFFKKLIKLDLSSNSLAWLSNNIFQINNLEVLILKNNDLGYIINVMTSDEMKDANWFSGLGNLRQLDISSNNLQFTFPSNVFKPLEKIHNMSMKDNQLRSFPNDFFTHLKTMENLDISDNPSLVILNWERLLQDLKNLKYLETNKFTDCCFVENLIPGAKCVAPKDEIANCDRMIKFPELRFLMWFLVVLTIGGNMFALLMRLVKDDANRVQNMLICSLSFSDMLMGVYLAGIINQEINTRGEYYKHDYYWRTGSLCKVFGIISVISSEVSVFTLVFIAYDRFLHIVHALEFKKIGYRTAVFLLGVTWFGCTAIAVIPATVQSYFYDETRRQGFYGTNPICMPLQLPGEDTIAWEYCLAVFGVMNFIGAVYLIVAYCQMFYSSYTSAKTSKNKARLGVHTTMAKRFAAVVFTDVCCWVPIAMLLLLSLARAINDSGNELYMWFSICVIPINSAINPILYTLSTPLFWQKVKDTIKKMLFCISKGNVTADKPELIAKMKREKKT